MYKYASTLFRADIKHGVETVLRRRCMATELRRQLDRQQDRASFTSGAFDRRLALEAELRRSRERSARYGE